MKNQSARPLRKLAGWALLALTATLLATTVAPTDGAQAGVVVESDVAPVWSVHETGSPVLVTTSTHQYVAYYDADLYLTVAQRPLNGTTWTIKKTDVVSRWSTSFHHAIAMQVDSAGNVHVLGAMHAEGLKYFRTTTPGDLNTLTRQTSMVGNNETSVTYPVLLKDNAGDLYLMYRSGSSGNGNTLINKYDATTSTWTRLVSPLFNGVTSGESAYAYGPTLGPDGRFHLAWVWRQTGGVETNHDVSYASSADLVNWETASGQSITLPLTPTTPGVVADPVPQNGGVFNGQTNLGFDNNGAALISYVKYDANGNTQVYTARFSGGSWSVVQASNWDFRWDFSGGGTITMDVKLGTLKTTSNPNELALDFQHAVYGNGQLVVSQSNLAPVRTVEQIEVARLVPGSYLAPETVSPPRPMTVEIVPDQNKTSGYALRWEHGPTNGDLALPQPWPAATMLTVVQLNAATEQYLSGNIAQGKTVTASSSYEQSGWGKASLVNGELFQKSGQHGYSSSSSTGSNHSEWVTVDLQSVRSIRQVSLFQASANGLPVDYSVQVSTDNSTWTTVASRTGVAAGSGQLTDTFAAASGRYVRILATSLRANPLDANQYRLQLSEIQVMEVPASVPPTPVPSASSTYQTATWALSKIVNGVTASTDPGWTSNSSLNSNHQEWVRLDLRAARTVSQVNLYPSGAGVFYPKDLKIEVSVDGQSWTTVYQGTNVAIPTSVGSYTFTAQSVRYVRVTGTSLRQYSGDGNKYRMQFAEIVVP